MGQTLSHGVYLPNEGERNCYAGLASNWQILNTAVGNIAEKAPLVHTHTVSQITDFPVYGNAAGTICEGNDSRLSDARTPVAHTHTKSDVTDLLNSNFIPSANNSYGLGSSSYKWKTLNGVNPGALSLPKYATASAQDISGDMIPDTYGNIKINPTLDGWMYVDFNISNATTSSSEMYVQVKDDAIARANYVVAFGAFTGSNHIFVYLPVLKSALVNLQVNFTGFSIGKGYIYPCQGNV